MVGGEIEVYSNFYPIFFFEQGGGERDGDLVAFAIDVEVQCAGAVVVEVAKAIGVFVAGEVEDIAQVGIIPEGEVEFDEEVVVEDGWIGAEYAVGSALGKQAIQRIELQALCVGLEDIKAQDKRPYGFIHLHKRLVKCCC